MLTPVQSLSSTPWIQGIYWANIHGISQPTNLKHWRGYFGDYADPYMIWTGTNHLPLHELKLNSEAVRYLNKKGFRIFFFEPLHLKLEGQEHNRGYFSEFESNTPYSSIRSDELDSIQEFTKKYQLTNIGIYCPNYRIGEVLQNTYPKIELADDSMFGNFTKRMVDLSANLSDKIIKKVLSVQITDIHFIDI